MENPLAFRSFGIEVLHMRPCEFLFFKLEVEYVASKINVYALKTRVKIFDR